MAQELSIQEVARIVGTTSRTLRHYDAIGLLAPSRVAGNGYRYYDQGALIRLQRILLLRDLGLGLRAIGEVLDSQRVESTALAGHLGWLRQEQDRLARQIASVEKTMKALEEGDELMAEHMFDGFDHTRYEEEVVERWGADAYARSDAWWRGLSATDRASWQKRSSDLAAAWTSASASGTAPESAEAQALAARQVEWLTAIPATPASDGSDAKGYLIGLGDMYVADPRFAANYGGATGAEFVRDALRVYVENNL